MNETLEPAPGVYSGSASLASNWPINAFARPPRPPPPVFPPVARKSRNTGFPRRPRGECACPRLDGEASFSRGSQGADLKVIGWETKLSSTCFPRPAPPAEPKIRFGYYPHHDAPTRLGQSDPIGTATHCETTASERK